MRRRVCISQEGGRGATERIFQLVPWLCYDSLSNGRRSTTWPRHLRLLSSDNKARHSPGNKDPPCKFARIFFYNGISRLPPATRQPHSPPGLDKLIPRGMNARRVRDEGAELICSRFVSPPCVRGECPQKRRHTRTVIRSWCHIGTQ